MAAGLLISDVVTYNALRSFLTTRVDQQLEAAAFPVGRALLSSSGLGTAGAGRPSGHRARHGEPVGNRHHAVDGEPRRLEPARQGPARTLGPRGIVPERRRAFGGPPGSQRGLLVTPGTYGQLRSATGKVEAHLFFSYGGKAPTAPVIPARLPGVGAPGEADRFFTTSSSGAELGDLPGAGQAAGRRHRASSWWRYRSPTSSARSVSCC